MRVAAHSLILRRGEEKSVSLVSSKHGSIVCIRYGRGDIAA
jgi:hypothetical protein